MDTVLSILAGQAPLPPTRFVGYDGHIDDDSWRRLVNALRTNKNALGVRLRGCGLKCRHAGHLAEVLLTNTTLEVLELPDNEIDEAGVHALVDTLRLNNSTLKSIDLSGNPCLDTTPHMLQELDTFMKRNRVIKKLPKTPVGSCGSVRPLLGAGMAVATTASTPSKGLGSPQPLNTCAMSTGLLLRGVSFEVEQRLQHLEEAEATIRSELDHVRSFSSQSEMWQKKIDTAGQQIAAILSLVDSRNTTLESRLQAMEHWRAGAEQAWANQSKVMEDMAGQLIRMMHRLQNLEVRLGSDDLACMTTGPGLDLAAGPPALTQGPDPGASSVVALQGSVQLLAERLERLESLVQANGITAPVRMGETAVQLDRHGLVASVVGQQEQIGVDDGSNDSEVIVLPRSLSPEVRPSDDEPNTTNAQQPKSAEGDNADVSGGRDGAPCSQRMYVTISSSLSELSAVDAPTPGQPDLTLGSPLAGVGSTGLSPSPMASGGDDSIDATRRRRQHHPRSRSASRGRSHAGGAIITDAAADTRQSIEPPGSPIMWHVNTFAAFTSGSEGLTPLHGLRPPATATAMGTVPCCTPDSAARSEPPSAQESLPSQGDSHMALDASCSNFVMYKSAARRASDLGAGPGTSVSRRYSLARQDSGDSVNDFGLQPRCSAPSAQAQESSSVHDTSGSTDSGSCALSPGPVRSAAAVAMVAVAGLAVAPGCVEAEKEGQGRISCPGTPQASTFSVDAETVSLSVAFAGSAARPRAPAAATTTDVSPMTLALRTKDPSDGERDSAATTTPACSGAEGSISVVKGEVDEAEVEPSAGSSNALHGSVQSPAAWHQTPTHPQASPGSASPSLSDCNRCVVLAGSTGLDEMPREETSTPRATWTGTAGPASHPVCCTSAATTPCAHDAVTPTSRPRRLGGPASGSTERTLLPRALAASPATTPENHPQAATPTAGTSVTPRSAPGRYVPSCSSGAGRGRGSARSPVHSSGFGYYRDTSRGSQVGPPVSTGPHEPHRQTPAASTPTSMSSVPAAAAGSSRLLRPSSHEAGGQVVASAAGGQVVASAAAAAHTSVSSSIGATGRDASTTAAPSLGAAAEGADVTIACCKSGGQARAGPHTTGGPGAHMAAGGPPRMVAGVHAHGPHVARHPTVRGDFSGTATHVAGTKLSAAAATRGTQPHSVSNRQVSHGINAGGGHYRAASSSTSTPAPYAAASRNASSSRDVAGGGAAGGQDLSMRMDVCRSRKPEEGSADASLCAAAVQAPGSAEGATADASQARAEVQSSGSAGSELDAGTWQEGSGVVPGSRGCKDCAGQGPVEALGEGGGNGDAAAPVGGGHPHVPHNHQYLGSSRILKAGAALTTGRALTSGTTVNTGPLAKAGAARGVARNVTSVAGATKRWM